MTTFELTQNYHLEGIEFYNAMDQVRQAFTKYQIKAYFDENSTGVIIVVEDDSDEKVEQIMRDNNIRWRV